MTEKIETDTSSTDGYDEDLQLVNEKAVVDVRRLMHGHR